MADFIEEFYYGNLDLQAQSIINICFINVICRPNI